MFDSDSLRFNIFDSTNHLAYQSWVMFKNKKNVGVGKLGPNKSLFMIPMSRSSSSAMPPSLMSSRNDTLCCWNPGCRVNHLVWIISYILNLLCLGHAISLNSQKIHTQALNVWYIYLHFWLIFMAHVDKWDRNLYNSRWFFLSSISFFKPLNGRPVPRCPTLSRGRKSNLGRINWSRIKRLESYISVGLWWNIIKLPADLGTTWSHSLIQITEWWFWKWYNPNKLQGFHV